RDGIRKRLAEAVEIATRQNDSIVKIWIASGDDGREMVFSQKPVCLKCGAMAPELTPALFSFNSPEGAGPRCNGLCEILPGGKRVKDGVAAPCPECGGTRLKKTSRAVHLGGRDIVEVSGLPIRAAGEWLHGLSFPPGQETIGAKIVDEIGERLGVMTRL